MITLLVVAALFIGLVFAIGTIVPQDGYGHRPAPRSHLGYFDSIKP